MRLASFEAGAAAARGAAPRRAPVRHLGPEGSRECGARTARSTRCSRAGCCRRCGRVENEGLPVEAVNLLPPVGRPGKIICIGLNYRSHAEEQGIDPPETPTFFAKFATALASPGAIVRLPPWSRKVDYEAEVAFVVGSCCKDVTDRRCHAARGRVHSPERPLSPRLPVQDAAMDARQDLRRRSALRPCPRHGGRGRPARRHRDRAAPQRRGDADRPRQRIWCTRCPSWWRTSRS